MPHWLFSHRTPPCTRLPRPPLPAGQRDLANAVQRCGGGRRVAEQLGLEFEERRGRKRKHNRDAASRLPSRPPESALHDDFVLI